MLIPLHWLIHNFGLRLSFLSPVSCKMAGAAGVATRLAQNAVKPLISNSNAEAKRRVLRLYKAWYRQIPFVCTLSHPYVVQSILGNFCEDSLGQS